MVDDRGAGAHLDHLAMVGALDVSHECEVCHRAELRRDGEEREEAEPRASRGTASEPRSRSSAARAASGVRWLVSWPRVALPYRNAFMAASEALLAKQPGPPPNA